MTAQEPTERRPTQEPPVELTATEARQGVLGRPVLVVLVAGLALAMVAWAAAEFWGTSIDTQTPTDATRISDPS